jgi:prepilin-type N-terminal cleavage/methylation domain-containing protein
VKKRKGFSLIELLMVVAIILMIAAIAIPNLMRSRMAANESSAVGSVRTINTAEVSYAEQFPDTGYALTLDSLGGTAVACAPGNCYACCCVLDRPEPDRCSLHEVRLHLHGCRWSDCGHDQQRLYRDRHPGAGWFDG